MKQNIRFILILAFFNLKAAIPGYAQLNGSYVITGKVIDDHGNALEAVSIQITDTDFGAVSDSSGNFKLVANKPFPFKLQFTMVGYTAKFLTVHSLSDNISVQLFSQS